MNNAYIAIDDSKVNPPDTKEIRGVNLNVTLSPFDIPENVTSDFNEKTGRLLLRFEYSNAGEKLVCKSKQASLKVVTGKTSGRIYELDIDTSKFFSGDVSEIELTVSVERIEEEIAEYSSNGLRAQSVQAIGNILEQYKADLFKPTLAYSTV